MNKFFKTALTIFAFLYVISPWDLLPGPIDDIAVMVATYFVNQKINQKLAKTNNVQRPVNPENFVYADYEVE